jgi:hypothetical protein
MTSTLTVGIPFTHLTTNAETFFLFSTCSLNGVEISHLAAAIMSFS